MASKSGMKIVASGLRHRNKQTLGANSETVIAEAVDNPTYLENATKGKRQGMLIERARVYMQMIDPIDINFAAGYVMSHQLQTGNNEGTPALVEPIDNTLVMHAATQVTVATAVGYAFARLWPVELESMVGLPLIVTPMFTVTHDFDYNHASLQSKDVYTIIDYSVVEIDGDDFATMLMNQQRNS